jgi:hypothetical protein
VVAIHGRVLAESDCVNHVGLFDGDLPKYSRGV